MSMERVSLLEERLPREAVEEFKAIRDFSIIVEKLLSDKILNLYEDSST